MNLNDLPYELTDDGKFIKCLVRTYASLEDDLAITVIVPRPKGPVTGWADGQRDAYMQTLDVMVEERLLFVAKLRFGPHITGMALLLETEGEAEIGDIESMMPVGDVSAGDYQA
jgi:hypothetical protein